MNPSDVQPEAGQENFMIIGNLSRQEYENLVETIKKFSKTRDEDDQGTPLCECTGGGAKSGGDGCTCPSGAGAKLV